MARHTLTMVWESDQGEKTETLVLEMAEGVTYSTADYIYGMVADEAEAYAIRQGLDGSQWAGQR